MTLDDTPSLPRAFASPSPTGRDGRLRLVGSAASVDQVSPKYGRRGTDVRADRPANAVGQQVGEPIESPTDPRWVLALRTAESLEGDLLPADRRERLVKVGKLLGLTPFDCHLVIAIVQEQARRGYAPEYCPTAGEPELRLVPRPRDRSNEPRLRMQTALVLGAFLLGEAVILWWSLSAVL